MVLNKIFVIVDPTVEVQPAFERALQSAQMTGTRLHIYACLTDEVAAGDREQADNSIQEQMNGLLARCEASGVEAAQEIEWAQDWSQQVIRAASRTSASMVFKNSFEHSDVQREMRPTSDFTLLRLSPCPVLLVKDIRQWESRRVLAAVNTLSTDDAHQKLNNQIISFAQNFTDAYGSDAHFVNAYSDSNHPPQVEDLSAICGAPAEHVHVVKGSAAQVISDLANEIKADLIIIGTVGRSGIKGRVVGNTSERILDHTGADVLVLN